MTELEKLIYNYYFTLTNYCKNILKTLAIPSFLALFNAF